VARLQDVRFTLKADILVCIGFWRGDKSEGEHKL